MFSVDQDGQLDQNIQNYEYSEQSAIHGMVFDPNEDYLYSADMWADKIWTHRKAPDGTLTLVGSVDAPSIGDHPRWVEMHPSGHYLYVLMEAGNRLGVYVIDDQTHLPVFTQTLYPLVPPGRMHIARQDTRKPQSNSSRCPRSQEDVQSRRRLLLAKRQVPLRDGQIQFAQRDRVRECVQTGAAGPNRATAVHQSDTQQRRPLECRESLSVDG